MKTPMYLFLSVALICLCSCSENKPPAVTAFTSSELSSLLDAYCWKFAKAPEGENPYWGARVIAVDRNDAVVGTSPYTRFADSFAKEAGQILVGFQIENGTAKGKFIAGGAALAFELKNVCGPNPSIGWSSGMPMTGDRTELVRIGNASGATESIIFLEMLRAEPEK